MEPAVGEDGASSVRFEASGQRLHRSWWWLAFPALFAAIGTSALLAQKELGVVAQAAAVLCLAVGLVRRSRKASPAVVRVAGGLLLANDFPLLALADVVGVNVVQRGAGRLLTIHTRSNRTVALAFDDEAPVTELRTLLRLESAQPAAQSFAVHAPLGCLTGPLAFGGTLFAVMAMASATSRTSLVVSGTLMPLALAGGPLLFALLKAKRLVVGEEGLWIRSLWGGRLVPWADVVKAEIAHGEVVRVTVVQRKKNRHAVLAFEAGSLDNAARLQHAITEHRGATAAVAREPDTLALLARGEQPTSAWLADVRRRSSPVAEGYRSGGLPEDRLWAVVGDPGADPSARVAAALALRTQSGDRFRIAEVAHRIRVASAATSLPEVRGALQEVAEEEDDDAAYDRVARRFAR